MSSKIHPASTNATAFDCPHCGAYASHTWFTVNSYDIFISDYRTPNALRRFYIEEMLKRISSDNNLSSEDKQNYTNTYKQIIPRLIKMIKWRGSDSFMLNLWISKCFNCNELSVWGVDNLIYPPVKIGIPANEDMPEEMKVDYDEASMIVNLSPRGAAALLRLSIQKLCIHLGEKGENLNTDIGNLVKKGLDQDIKKALDIVRVTGNEAVHPGSIELKDDKQTVISLFELVNLIVEQMISRPKKIESMYKSLPEIKREQIEKRDNK